MGERAVMRDGRKAPKLYVQYRCPECHTSSVLNVYDGPPSCLGKLGMNPPESHPPVFCIPGEIVEDVL